MHRSSLKMFSIGLLTRPLLAITLCLQILFNVFKWAKNFPVNIVTPEKELRLKKTYSKPPNLLEILLKT